MVSFEVIPRCDPFYRSDSRYLTFSLTSFIESQGKFNECLFFSVVLYVIVTKGGKHAYWVHKHFDSLPGGAFKDIMYYL